MSIRERRKERRYRVALKAELHCGGKTAAVTITQLSASGAQIEMPDAPPVGLFAELFIAYYGTIDAEIVHIGPSFCGLSLHTGTQKHAGFVEQLRAQLATSAGAQ